MTRFGHPTCHSFLKKTALYGRLLFTIPYRAAPCLHNLAGAQEERGHDPLALPWIYVVCTFVEKGLGSVMQV